MDVAQIKHDISTLESNIFAIQAEIRILRRTANEALAAIGMREQLIAQLEDKLDARRRQLKEKV